MGMDDSVNGFDYMMNGVMIWRMSKGMSRISLICECGWYFQVEKLKIIL